MVWNNSSEFRETVARVARDLVTIEHRDGFSFVKTSIRYPSGSSAVVRVGDASPDFFVTDFGGGYDEADMMGASGAYNRYAQNIAREAGIGFDHHAFFVMKASRERLAGAIVTVANCSRDAVSIAAFKLAERKFSDQTDALYRRLITVFPHKFVAKDAEITGGSNTKWHVATLVRANHGRTIFEPVSSHHTSVFSAATKFHDISRVENAPSRVALVRNKEELRTYLAVLQDSANVVEENVPDTTLLELAHAA